MIIKRFVDVQNERFLKQIVRFNAKQTNKKTF